jgi:hypothetical protein
VRLVSAIPVILVLLTSAEGQINTVVGTGAAGFGGDDGLASAARLDQPFGVAEDREGNLFIADILASSRPWPAAGAQVPPATADLQ